MEIKNLLQKLFSFWKKEPEPKIEIKLPPIKVFVQKKKFIKKPKCPVKFKTSYNEEIAKKEAVKMTKGKLKLRAYRCEFCPHWHLTHQRLLK